MKKLNKKLFETREDMTLYNKSVSLFEKIERENAFTITINDIAMGYLEFGSNTGTPLIWAHGSGFTSYEILNVQAGLVEAGYRVIAIDYRGHGKTQINLTKYNCSIYHIADDIAALMDHLGIRKAIIGGLSKGGWIAAAFYDAYPKRVLGLLLEDGGSWSHLRLKEDIQLKSVQPGPLPCEARLAKRLFDTSTFYKTRYEGLKAVWGFYSPAIKARYTVEYITFLLSLLRIESDGRWVFHSALSSLTTCDPQCEVEDSVTGSTYYSRLPLMQQSQELMIPFVVFRHLNVPLHIIDPDSPSDWLPVRHQNEELQAMFPELITHEVYEYEHSPHEAHLERPERFIESAKALLKHISLIQG